MKDDSTSTQSTARRPDERRPTVPRWTLSIPQVLLAFAIAAFIIGATLIEVFASEVFASWDAINDLLSLKTIGLNYAVLQHHVAENFNRAAVLYVIGYGLLGLFLLPGSALVVILSGLIFGATLGIPLAILGSVLAASLAYGTARLTLGRSLKSWNHPTFEALRTGFKRHALSYMMFLRLTPGLPFSVLNVAPALLQVPFWTFIFGTFVGVLPSRFALSTAGAGLAKVIDRENVLYSQCVAGRSSDAAPCAYNIHVASLLTREMVVAFFILAMLALMPAILDTGPRLWRKIKAV